MTDKLKNEILTDALKENDTDTLRIVWINNKGEEAMYYAETPELVSLMLDILRDRDLADDTVRWNTHVVEHYSPLTGTWEEWGFMTRIFTI
jgi:hypothetical protein